MTLVRRLALAAAIAMVAAAAGAATQSSTALGSSARPTRGDTAATARNLVRFRSCGDLLGYVKSQTARLVGPWGLGGAPSPSGVSPVAAPATAAAASGTATPREGVDYSGTNVQEQGVDEPDLVKTNGMTLFAVANGMLNAVDVTAAEPRLLDTLKLDEGWDHQLLLHGNRLLVLSRGGAWIMPLPAVAASLTPYAPSGSVLSEIDVSNPKALRVVQTLTLDGSYVAARLVGGSARIVAASRIPEALPFARPAASDAATLAAAQEQNRAVVAESPLTKWLPSYRIARRGRPAVEKSLVQCRHVSRPQAFSGLGMLTLLTIDLDKGLEPVDSVGVMTDARIVYASTRSLYVATERWADRPGPDQPLAPKSGVTTSIHRFDISNAARSSYRGSGSVSGFLLSQWALSEERGVLRVVSTETPAWWGPGPESESFLTTLRLGDGVLVQAGRIGELGKGERVYAVRFVGDVAYVVTFRRIDPLYTVDVADPDRPRVLGELKIEGYSAYLHPIGDDLLLGVGQDASDTGRPLGTQVSIFDVSNLRRPARLDKVVLGAGASEAEWDHHAFLFWPRTGLAVLPFTQNARALRVGRARGIADVGTIAHAEPRAMWAPIRRALVVGESLLTVSARGVASNRLDTLDAEGWVAFPAPVTVQAGR